MDGNGVRALYYLVSAAGFPNYGDELIAATWLRHLAGIAPDADVWLDCPHPGTAAAVFDGIHPRARFTDTFWQLAWQAPVAEPMDVSAWVQHAVRDPGLGARWAAGIDIAAHADVVHVLGGGFVNDRWPRHIGVVAAAAAAARRSGGRAVLTGAGLTPARRSTARTLAALADRFDVVDVRDEASARLLDRPGSMTADDVFLCPEPPLATDRDSAPGHMLCLQSDHLDDTTVRDLAAYTLGVLREWGAAPDDVGVVEGIPGHDRSIFALLEHELPGARFYPFSEIWANGLPAAPHQTWLSTRFHMHLLAAWAGASGIALETDTDYYATKHASLVDAGSGWSSVADRERIAPRPTGAFDPGTVQALVRAKQRVATAVYPQSTPSPAGPAEGDRWRMGTVPEPREAEGVPRSWWRRRS